ncbi:MAG: hypothetical protein OXC61_08105 [Flavobacteriaceae bacterium]|nr:hypothetical protein [Flavobacteriaceae bacterium]
MAYHVTMDVRAQTEALEKEEQQEALVASRDAARQEQQDPYGGPQKEDTGSERSCD